MSIDERTGYPPGYVPGVWLCPKCGEEWSDESQCGDDSVAWHMDAECPCEWPAYTTMNRVRDL